MILLTCQFKSLQVQTLLNILSRDCIVCARAKVFQPCSHICGSYYLIKSLRNISFNCSSPFNTDDLSINQCNVKQRKDFRAHQVHKQASIREEEAARAPTLRHAHTKYRVRYLWVLFNITNYRTDRKSPPYHCAPHHSGQTHVKTIRQATNLSAVWRTGWSPSGAPLRRSLGSQREMNSVFQRVKLQHTWETMVRSIYVGALAAPILPNDLASDAQTEATPV